MEGVDDEPLAWLTECRDGRSLWMLMLQGPSPSAVVPRWRERRGWQGELLDEYLPQELRVVDACETNAGFVWLAKHFYL